MNKEFEKILERLEELQNNLLSQTEGDANLQVGVINGVMYSKKIVQEVAEEYKGDMKHNLAEMYAKNMVDYGVDVTEAWQTAMQQSCALEKAYIRGRQYEVDRFNKLRKEHNGGWISCSEKLPELRQDVLVTVKYTGFMGMYGYWIRTGHMEAENDWWGDCAGGEVIAWQPLPEPFKERD